MKVMSVSYSTKSQGGDLEGNNIPNRFVECAGLTRRYRSARS